MAGATAGFVVCVATQPLDVLRTRCQVCRRPPRRARALPSLTLAAQTEGSGLRETMVRTWREARLAGYSRAAGACSCGPALTLGARFFLGWRARLVMQVPHGAMLITAYETQKRLSMLPVIDS